MRLLLFFFMLFLIPGATEAIDAADGPAEILLLGGTVMAIDQDSSSVTLRLPSGESRLFALIDRRILKDISIGDHVTYELNDAGKIIRIVKLPTDPAN